METMETELEKFIRQECNILREECEDYSDAASYAPEILNDAKEKFQWATEEELEERITKTLKEIFNL